MTTGGEGGMLTTNRRDCWEQAWAYKDHGKSWSAVYEREHPPGFGFRWLNESFGTNWRMIEMQAAIGRIQLRRLVQWHERRKANVGRLAAVFSTLQGLRVPMPPVDVEHAWYKFYSFVQPEALAPGWSRDRIMAEVNAAGVPCYSGSCSEVYLEKAFDGTGWRPAQRLAVAKALGETSLMFLVHPTLTDEEIEKTYKVVAEVMGRAMEIS